MKTDPKYIKTLQDAIEGLTKKVDSFKETIIEKINCLEKKIVNTRAKLKLWERIWLIILSGGFVIMAAIISTWR